jgi:hypothetical protein
MLNKSEIHYYLTDIDQKDWAVKVAWEEKGEERVYEEEEKNNFEAKQRQKKET